jgi:hypothetical protein
MCQATGRRVCVSGRRGESPEPQDEEEGARRAGPIPAPGPPPSGTRGSGSSRGTGIAFPSRFCCRGISPHHSTPTLLASSSPLCVFFFPLIIFVSFLILSPWLLFPFPLSPERLRAKRKGKQIGNRPRVGLILTATAEAAGEEIELSSESAI